MAKMFFLPDQISSQTKIGDKAWKDIKREFCCEGKISEANQKWYNELTEYQNELLADLK